jgi:hypothetical protein
VTMKATLNITNKYQLHSGYDAINFIHCQCITIKLLWPQFDVLQTELFTVLVHALYEFG